jgi:hypothetical protein
VATQPVATDEIRSTPSEAKPQLKDNQPKRSGYKPISDHFLVVVSDVDCSLTVDGESGPSLIQDRPSKVPVGLGDHILVCTTKNGYSTKQSASVSQDDTQKILSLNAKEYILGEEKKKADKAAEEKRKQDQIDAAKLQIAQMKGNWYGDRTFVRYAWRGKFFIPSNSTYIDAYHVNVNVHKEISMHIDPAYEGSSSGQITYDNISYTMVPMEFNIDGVVRRFYCLNVVKGCLSSYSTDQTLVYPVEIDLVPGGSFRVSFHDPTCKGNCEQIIKPFSYSSGSISVEGSVLRLELQMHGDPGIDWDTGDTREVYGLRRHK